MRLGNARRAKGTTKLEPYYRPQACLHRQECSGTIGLVSKPLGKDKQQARSLRNLLVDGTKAKERQKYVRLKTKEKFF
jgi:hypothetical protein